MRSSGPIGARESARIAGNIHAHIHALERSDYPLRPPAPQEKKQSFSRVADTASFSPDRQESSRFCPRVFAPKGHFSQKSALKQAQIRALLWAYRGPRATGCRGWCTTVYAHMQARVNLQLITLHICPSICRQLSINSIPSIPAYLWCLRKPNSQMNLVRIPTFLDCMGINYYCCGYQNLKVFVTLNSNGRFMSVDWLHSVLVSLK